MGWNQLKSNGITVIVILVLAMLFGGMFFHYEYINSIQFDKDHNTTWWQKHKHIKPKHNIK